RSGENFKNAIIFCNRKREVAQLHRSLLRHGFNAAALHGDMDQPARMAALDSFRKGDVALLIASDVAARGLDIPDVSHVFNYDVPHHADDYVHRIGRTGRAGRLGDTFMIVTPADGRSLDKVLKLIGKAPDEVTLDVDWSQVRPSERRTGRADERRSRERGGAGRDRTRSPGREPAAAAAGADDLAERAEPAPAQEPAADRPARSPRRPPPAAAEPKRPAPREERPALAAQRDERDDRG